MQTTRLLPLILGVFYSIILCMPPTICVANEKRNKAKTMGKNFKEKVMDTVPYSEELEQTWNIIDGDVDLMGIQGLRGDRKNKGLEYKTNALPLIGEVDGVEFKFKTGDKNEFSFKSQITPFIGDIKGLSYRGYTNTNNSAIFARYTIALD